MLSLVGVEAKYVRLTFQVEAPNGNTTADFPAGYRCVKGRETLNAYASSREIIIADRPRSQRLDLRPFPDSLYMLARTASS